MKILSIVVMLTCLPLLAGDPWKTKKAAEWSGKDAQRILTDSPWAKSVSAEMNFSGMGESGGRGGPGSGMGGPGGGGGMGGPGGGGGMGGPGGGGGMGGPGGGGMGGPGGGMGSPEGGMGRQGGGMQAPKLLVRWESAEPIREAMIRVEDKNAAKLAEWSKEFYVISTSGMMRMRRDGRPRPDDGRMQQMQEQMREATSLKVKGKDAIPPARIEHIETEDGMLTAFLFPRNLAIEPSAKEAIFETSMGPMVIKSKFNLKDMQYLGKPAL